MYSLKQLTDNWYGNLSGGITAAIVALPLALAFGISSGAGPVSGLYGAIIVGFFAALFGGTPSQISGPTGPMTVVMTAMIAHFVAEYPDQGMALAFTTVFLGGVIQILFGMLRLGKYIIMVPYPVISGFMTGIGAIIILLQLGPLLGFDSASSVLDAVAQLGQQLTHANSDAVIIGVVTLAVVFLWRGKVSRILPAPLMALVVATLVALYSQGQSELARIGDIPSALPGLQIPTFNLDLARDMLINALMLAILGSIDSLLTSLVADNLTGVQHKSDKELIGQGLGNAIAGLFGGLPGAGATMRTVVNIRSGGDGPLSGMLHALTLLLIVVGIGFIFSDIPLAALAGVLIKVGIDIIDWPFLKRLHRLPLFPVALMTLVLALTVFADLITAVFIGVFIKNLVTIHKLSALELGNVILTDGSEEHSGLSDEERSLLNHRPGEAILVRITGPVSYAVARGLTNRFAGLEHKNTLLIDVSQASIIGISTAMVLEELVRQAQSSGSQVKLIDANCSQRDELTQLDLISLIGKEHCYPSVQSAVAAI